MKHANGVAAFLFLMGCHKRGPWSQHEDTLLLSLVNSQGAHNWVRISQIIGSRTPKQCRERYHQNLKPSLNHEPISPEEGLLIERLVGEMGKRWAEIARRLRGRSDNAVKNWWNGGMNRRRRLVGRREGSGRTCEGFNERNDYPSYARHVPLERPMRSIHIPSPSNSIEPSMISPASSDACMSESISEAPSLVSDHGSQFSPSPKVHSPLIMLPPLAGLPIVPRPNSLPSLHIGSGSSMFELQSPIRPGGQPSSLPSLNRGLEQLADEATRAKPVSSPESYRKTYQITQMTSPSGDPLPTSKPRDTRMNVDHLLL